MYRKRGMERLQDSLLQDLERATTNLKNNPGTTGGWKLNRPDDSTIAPIPVYASNKVVKRYSPHYYHEEEPLYQNESLKRSNSTASSHDYAAVNGRTSATPRSPTTTTPMHEVNGRSNGYLVNGDSGRGRQQHDQSDQQVNQLIKDLEYSLHSTTRSASPPVSKPKTVTFENAMPQPKAQSPGPTHSAQIQPVSEYNRNLVNMQPQAVRMNNQPIIQVPLPHGGGTSNATRELDDLMASLSDFKMNQMKGQTPSATKSNFVSLGRVQVPAKNGQVLYRHPNPTDLDSMIGDLEYDLNKQGVSTTPKGDCGACGRPIVGQVVTAMGKIFHPEHFTCAKCNTQLGNQSFFEREGLAYCEDDYHRLFSPKCSYCSKPILDRCITALDKTWHPEHFFCAHCGKNFGDDGYHEKAGNAYCREDFFKLFAPKCAGCSTPIVDNYVSALGAHWHSDCFVCRDCHLPFDGGNYFDIEGQPFCESHYHDKRGTLCASCRKPIEGRCITAMFQKYHPEHFTCSFCLMQLNKGTFKKHQEKPYCHSCFDKLFA